MQFLDIVQYPTYRNCLTRYLQYKECIQLRVTNRKMLEYFSIFILETLSVNEKSTIDSLKDIEKVHSLYISVDESHENNNQNYSYLISLFCCILNKFKFSKDLYISIYNSEYYTLYPILFRYVKEMKYLKKLEIGFSAFEEEMIAYDSTFLNMISKLKNLETLSISQIHNSFSKQILEFSCRTLVSLTLNFNGDEDKNFNVDLQNFPNLQSLSVDFRTNFVNTPRIEIQNFEMTNLRYFETLFHDNFSNLDQIILQKLEHIRMGNISDLPENFGKSNTLKKITLLCFNLECDQEGNEIPFSEKFIKSFQHFFSKEGTLEMFANNYVKLNLKKQLWEIKNDHFVQEDFEEDKFFCDLLRALHNFFPFPFHLNFDSEELENIIHEFNRRK